MGYLFWVNKLDQQRREQEEEGGKVITIRNTLLGKVLLLQDTLRRVEEEDRRRRRPPEELARALPRTAFVFLHLFPLPGPPRHLLQLSNLLRLPLPPPLIDQLLLHCRIRTVLIITNIRTLLPLYLESIPLNTSNNNSNNSRTTWVTLK